MTKAKTEKQGDENMNEDKISELKAALELTGKEIIKGYVKQGYYGKLKEICKVAGVELPKGIILECAKGCLDGADLNDYYVVNDLYKAYHLFELADVTDYPKNKFATYSKKCLETGKVKDAVFFSKVAGMTLPKEKCVALSDKCLDDGNIEEAVMLWEAVGVNPKEEPQKTKLLACADAHLEHASHKKLKDAPYDANPLKCLIKGFYTAYEAYNAAGMEPSKEKFGEALLKVIMEALQ